MVPPLAERIIRESTCGVFVASARTRFNCEKAWGRALRKNGLELDGQRGSFEGANPKDLESGPLAFSCSNRIAGYSRLLRIFNRVKPVFYYLNRKWW